MLLFLDLVWLVGLEVASSWLVRGLVMLLVVLMLCFWRGNLGVLACLGVVEACEVFLSV